MHMACARIGQHRQLQSGEAGAAFGRQAFEEGGGGEDDHAQQRQGEERAEQAQPAA